jgi:hypothetical protein
VPNRLAARKLWTSADNQATRAAGCNLRADAGFSACPHLAQSKALLQTWWSPGVQTSKHVVWTLNKELEEAKIREFSFRAGSISVPDFLHAAPLQIDEPPAEFW